MLFYLAYLQTISNDVYEAAAIDGANAWQTFWQITFPLLRAGVTSSSRPCRSSAPSRCSTRPHRGRLDGEPNYSLTTIVLYLYRAAFGEFDLGYAAAVGVVLFVDHLHRDAGPAAAVRQTAGVGLTMAARPDPRSDRHQAAPVARAVAPGGRPRGQRCRRRGRLRCS